VWGRSPDQFRLSRLKEGDRVCGGRGQFGNRPLWDLNTIPGLWIECGSTEVYKFDPLGGRFEDRMHGVNRKCVS